MEGELDSRPADCQPGSTLLATVQGSSRREYGAMDTTNARTPPANASLAAGDAEEPLRLPVPSPVAVRPPSYFDASGGGWGRAVGDGGHAGLVLQDDNEIHSEAAVFIDLKTVVFATMCMLSPSRTVSQCKQNCIAVSCFIHFLFSIVGMTITGIIAQSNDWIALPGAKIATILAGVFFVLLEVYWLALYWWRRIAGGRYQPSKRDFSALGFCWWLLSLYFIVVLTFLVGEISRKSDIVFGTVASSNGNNSSSDGGDGNVDVVLVRTALVSMVLYLYFCIAVFLVIKLEGIVSRRWNWKTQGSLLTV